MEWKYYQKIAPLIVYDCDHSAHTHKSQYCQQFYDSIPHKKLTRHHTVCSLSMAMIDTWTPMTPNYSEPEHALLKYM